MELFESQSRIIVRWERSRLSLRGEEVILKALVTTRAWFLTIVNGMSAHVEKEMIKHEGLPVGEG